MQVSMLAKASRIPGIARAAVQLFIDRRETWDEFTIETILDNGKALQQIPPPIGPGDKLINELDLILEEGVPMLVQSVHRAGDTTASRRKVNVVSHWLKRHPKLSGVLTQQWSQAAAQIATAAAVNRDISLAERFSASEEQVVGAALAQDPGMTPKSGASSVLTSPTSARAKAAPRAPQI